MMKALVVLAMLTAPAVADSAANYTVTVDLNKQHYSILLVDHACGDVKIKAPNKESTLRVCAKPTEQSRVTLEIERRSVDGASEVQTHSVINAVPKSAYNVLDMKVTLDVQ
jgi:hypothetical protein